MEQIKYRIVEYDTDVYVVVEDGGIACITQKDGEDGILATTEYFHDRITQQMNDDHWNILDVWETLDMGKISFNDWSDKEYSSINDERLITDALNWLVVNDGNIEFVKDDTIWNNIF